MKTQSAVSFPQFEGFKKLFSFVVPIAIALFLAVSLAGCGDDGGGESPLRSSGSDLVSSVSRTLSESSYEIPPGVTGLVFVFRSAEKKQANKEKIGQYLSQRVEIFKIEDNDMAPREVTYRFKALPEKVLVDIDTSNVFRVELMHVGGNITALWNINSSKG